MNLRIVFLLIVLFQCSSCSEELDFEQTHVDYVKLDSLTFNLQEFIDIDSQHSFDTRCSVKIIQGKLYYLNVDKQGIMIFDPNSKSSNLIFDFSIFRGKPKDFWVDDRGYYLLYDDPNRLIFVDKLSLTPYDVLPDENIYLKVYPFMNDKLSIDSGGNFVCAAFSDKDPSFNEFVFKTLNLDGQHISSFADHPNLLFQYQFPLMSSPSRITNRDTTLVSYGFSNKISVYADGELIQEHFARSNYIKAPIQGLNLKSSYQTISNYIIETAFYLGLYYNESEDRYYRFVKHHSDLFAENGKLNNRYEGDWSIICYDRNLVPLGEALMPANQFYYYAAFTNDLPGIWVSRIDEDLIFQRITFDQL